MLDLKCIEKTTKLDGGGGGGSGGEINVKVETRNKDVLVRRLDGADRVAVGGILMMLE